MSEGSASASIESRSAKELAEVEKLNVEIRIIKDQLSLKYNLREWLKAITGIAALGALFWSMITGFDQLQQARQDKQRDALERALNRLVSANTVERVVGANSVRAFLSGSDVRQRSIALVSLAGAMAQEHDASARSSILAAFKDLAYVPKTDLQYALSIVFEANRTLFAKDVTDQSSQLFAGPFATRVGANYLSDLAKAGLLPVRQGIAEKDFSGLYCLGCDFRGIDLSGSKFDNSFLMSATFDNTNLESSTFVNSALSNASFKKAKLLHARFSGSFIDSLPSALKEPKNVVSPSVDLHAVQFSPDFTCADLREANLNGLVFWGMYDRGADWEPSALPIFTQAVLDGVDLTKLNMFLAVPVEDRDELYSLARREGLSESRALNVRLLFRRSEVKGDSLVVHGEKVEPSKIIIFSMDQLDKDFGKLFERHREGTAKLIVLLARVFDDTDLRKARISRSLGKIISTVGKASGELIIDPTMPGGVRLEEPGVDVRRKTQEVCESVK